VCSSDLPHRDTRVSIRDSVSSLARCVRMNGSGWSGRAAVVPAEKMSVWCLVGYRNVPTPRPTGAAAPRGGTSGSGDLGGAAGRFRGLGLAALVGLGTRGGPGIGAVRLALAVALVLALRLEIGFVPAGALEAEARRGDLLFQACLAAGRAVNQPFVGNLLQRLEFVSAVGVGALVFVDGHGIGLPA